MRNKNDQTAAQEVIATAVGQLLARDDSPKGVAAVLENVAQAFADHALGLERNSDGRAHTLNAVADLLGSLADDLVKNGAVTPP